MHSYATDASDRLHVPIALGVLAAAAAIGLDELMAGAAVRAPWWTDVSAIGIYGILHRLFDSLGWRIALPVVRSEIPDVRGTWAGTIRTSHNEVGTFAVVFIRQTWSKISIRLQTESSESRSVMATLNTAAGPDPGLGYEYLNEPKNLAAGQTMHTHRGCARLQPAPDGLSLAGDYYTGRDRQNLGTMKVVLLTREELSYDEARGRWLIASAHPNQ